MKKKLADIGEFEIIDRFKKRFSRAGYVRVGIGDDTAVLDRDARYYDLITTDCVIEGSHFTRRAVKPYAIGWKAMARSLSDIAAMGGMPRAAVIAMACPKTLAWDYFTEMERGFEAAAKKFKCPIVGGDLSSAKTITIVATITGVVEKKRLVKRSGAKPGDIIMVTGSLGHSRGGKHATFTPRLAEGRLLSSSGCVSAMCDVSDGLVQDLSHILESSEAGADLVQERIPLSAAVKKHYRSVKDQYHHALTDGEDYELLFSVSVAKVERLMRLWKRKGMTTKITAIGRISQNSGIRIINPRGNISAVKVTGWTHF